VLRERRKPPLSRKPAVKKLFGTRNKNLQRSLNYTYKSHLMTQRWQIEFEGDDFSGGDAESLSFTGLFCYDKHSEKWA